MARVQAHVRCIEKTDILGEKSSRNFIIGGDYEGQSIAIKVGVFRNDDSNSNKNKGASRAYEPDSTLKTMYGGGGVMKIGQHVALGAVKKQTKQLEPCKDVIFTRIIACETPKHAWDRLKEEFQGTERTKAATAIELEKGLREFDEKGRNCQAVFRQNYGCDSRDLTSITLTELINALYAQEQRKGSRLEEHQEGAFQAKTKLDSSTTTYKGKKTLKDKPKSDAPRRWDRPCRHFSCSATQKKVSNGWLLDSGCANHMSPNAAIFKSLDKSCMTKVKVGNGHFIKAEGKGDVLICTPTGNKLISNVLFVPKIDKNLLSIAQLLEKGYAVVFKGSECKIRDPSGSMLMTVAITDKSFVFDWNKASNSAYTTSIDESKL
ncbi:uncharacterized protein [Gossypium hirsutum]|uniref:Retrovirus-related Pol polyprotein from transposon TNT 1-94-like beta-barrel domain-containing protein n=1 Tax=Gossypium hirsutum TaxID=3635 RepID=A0A1U8P6C7_GOSHI|nr:uncharacterized protein LOC107954666 [Gossypium hirsutum]